MHLPTIFLFLSSLPRAISWGSLGHTSVAYLATLLIAPQTTTLFQGILHNDTEHFLAGVATWADSYRYTAEGRYSGPLHFIDANDAPPTACGVVLERDCEGEVGGKEGMETGMGMCIVGGIKNYTSQILDRELVSWKRTMAAKFVVHFLGDIHQPLHTEHLFRGGNSIPVNFTSHPLNLHHVWDTSIIEHHIGSYSLDLASSFAKNLSIELSSGLYAPLVPVWLEDINLEEPTKTALKWANDANALVCTHVLPEGVEGVKGKELAGGVYEERAWEAVRMQIAKAGVRLAKWLDLIAEAALKKEEEEKIEL